MRANSRRETIIDKGQVNGRFTTSDKMRAAKSQAVTLKSAWSNMNVILVGKTGGRGEAGKGPILRFTQKNISLQSSMMIIAICALCFPMLAGMSGFMGYRGAKTQEMAERHNASTLRWETEREPPNHAIVWERVATEMDRNADSAASNAQRFWDSFISAVVLVALGIISGGLAITLRVWYGSEIRTRSRPAYYLFSATSTIALILLAAFIIAACLQLIAYARLCILGRL